MIGRVGVPIGAVPGGDAERRRLGQTAEALPHREKYLRIDCLLAAGSRRARESTARLERELV